MRLVIGYTDGGLDFGTVENRWMTATNEVGGHNKKSKEKTTLILFFDSKYLICREFVPTRQTMNVKFFFEAIKRSMPIVFILLDHGRAQERGGGGLGGSTPPPLTVL